MIGTAVFDADGLPAEFDFSTADRWQVLVLHRGRPADRVDLPSPGAVSDGALVEAALVRRADAERARGDLIDSLRRRLGSASPVSPPLRVSVVVCTHRRSQYLPDLLSSIRHLEPAPLEVIVVDNDPGAEDCRSLVEAAGFRYVLEPRRGLDNARNTGLRAARGDVVAFTDDDCVVSPTWLGALGGIFAHETVVAATGPAFPYLLDTPARVRMEHQASLARGFRRISFDWQTVSPLHAAAMGVGANMAIRRSRLLELGDEPFPPELDAGTETESGGDTYLLSRLLAGGGRVVYEPQMFLFHQHRPDGITLHRAVLGYGIGLSASLTKLVAEDRELTAPRAWAWLVKQYLKTQRRRAVGRADAIETRLAWDYLRGGFIGTGRWRKALRTQRSTGATASDADGGGESAPTEPAAASPVPAGDAPEISVIIPTFRREPALRRSLRGLCEQTAPAGTFEVVVVDDDPEGREARLTADSRSAYPFRLRRLGNPGHGAAAARNHGAREAVAPLLLFLDDDVVADPDLVRRHLSRHAENEAGEVLVGAYRPRPTNPGLCEQVARLWWQDFFDRLEESPEVTFVGALSANMSVARRLFERVGDFSEAYARARREDWEWGLRARRAGVRIAFDREASARHEFTLGTAQRLRDARREGFGDILIAEGYPEALPSLPLHSLRPVTPRQPVRWIGLRLWCRPAVRRLAIEALDLLEMGNFREAWSRLFRLAQSASYAQGAYEGGWKPGGATHPADVQTMEVELLSEDALNPPAVAAPVVRATLSGREVARVFPADGVWAPSIAEQIVDAMEPEDVARAAASRDPQPVAEPASDMAGRVELIFGPANPETDLAHRGELEALGAAVGVAGPASAGHWQALAEAARRGNRPLIAFPLPGTRPGPAWLVDSLAAFSGRRVGLVFGGSIAPGDPAEPLYLHDAQSADIELCLLGAAPAYLVLRRELLPWLEHGGGLLDPPMAALGMALRAGWAIGHRDARGLEPPSYRARERGEAFGRIEARTLRGPGGSPHGGGPARAGGRAVLTLAWTLLRQRGRLAPEQRELIGGIVRGSLGGLFREMRAGRRPRRLGTLDSPPPPARAEHRL